MLNKGQIDKVIALAELEQMKCQRDVNLAFKKMSLNEESKESKKNVKNVIFNLI